MVFLHGANGDPREAVDQFRPLADRLGIVLFAPVSVGHTWDMILGAYGPDLGNINQALEFAFRECAVDPRHLAIAGFSDGASYALSLGIVGPDRFSHVIAFSPGFVSGSTQHVGPRIFISHGSQDALLPVRECSRRIVSQLRCAGHDVEYLEYDDGHRIPPKVAHAALHWFIGMELA